MKNQVLYSAVTYDSKYCQYIGKKEGAIEPQSKSSFIKQSHKVSHLIESQESIFGFICDGEMNLDDNHFIAILTEEEVLKLTKQDSQKYDSFMKAHTHLEDDRRINLVQIIPSKESATATILVHKDVLLSLPEQITSIAKVKFPKACSVMAEGTEHVILIPYNESGMNLEHFKAKFTPVGDKNYEKIKAQFKAAHAQKIVNIRKEVELKQLRILIASSLLALSIMAITSNS